MRFNLSEGQWFDPHMLKCPLARYFTPKLLSLCVLVSFCIGVSARALRKMKRQKEETAGPILNDVSSRSVRQHLESEVWLFGPPLAPNWCDWV